MNITLDTDKEFKAIIKVKYDQNEFLDGSEKYQAFYHWNGEKWMIMADRTIGEDTSIDTNNNFVWAKTSHFSSFKISNPVVKDSDGDKLNDASELNWDNSPAQYINNFEEGISEIHFETPGEKHTYHLRIPEFDGATEYIGSTRLIIDQIPLVESYENLFSLHSHYTAETDIHFSFLDKGDIDLDGDIDLIGLV